MDIKEYFEKMKKIEEKLLGFLNQEDYFEENHENLIKILIDENILNDQYDLKIFLYQINKISNNHYRYHNFINKIEKVLDHIKDVIKRLFSNAEIFNIFRTNKRILLFLIESKILEIDYNIYQKMMLTKYKEMKYPEYFSPEIISFIEEEKNKSIFDAKHYDQIKEILKEDFKKFNEKRKNGENDGFLPQIIQKDLIDDFITYVNKNNYLLNSQIEKSIFETNEFLIKQKQTNLIEYAAFHGSVQIFKYLYKNDAKVTSILWVYAIHGCDAEIIKILEEVRIMKFDSEQCIAQSIRCFHNYITDYIQDNFQMKSNNISKYGIKNYNFLFVVEEDLIEDLFFYACKYGFGKIVEHYLKTKDFDTMDMNDVLLFICYKIL